MNVLSPSLSQTAIRSAKARLMWNHSALRAHKPAVSEKGERRRPPTDRRHSLGDFDGGKKGGRTNEEEEEKGNANSRKPEIKSFRAETSPGDYSYGGQRYAEIYTRTRAAVVCIPSLCCLLPPSAAFTRGEKSEST